MLMALVIIGAQAHATTTGDTVKVIDNPDRAVITQDGDDNTSEDEVKDVNIMFPFKKCDAEENAKPHIDFFLSDVYVGWGRTNVQPGARDIISRSTWEAGVLNVVGMGLVFNRCRTRLSLGVGFNWSNYRLKSPYFWATDDNGRVGYADGSEMADELDAEIERRSTNLQVRSLQVPLLFSQKLGKRFSVTAGGVMNWNFFADISNRYSVGKDDVSITTRGLHQRKISFDAIAMLYYRSLGVYFRYSPQSLFKSGEWGPKLNNRWALGIIFGGF